MIRERREGPGRRGRERRRRRRRGEEERIGEEGIERIVCCSAIATSKERNSHWNLEEIEGWNEERSNGKQIYVDGWNEERSNGKQIYSSLVSVGNAGTDETVLARLQQKVLQASENF